MTIDLIDEHVRRSQPAQLTTLLLKMSEAERTALAPQLEKSIKATRSDDWWQHGVDIAAGYALAVIGCAPTAGRAAALLCRRDIRDRWHTIQVERFLRIARARELPWLGDLGVRLAERLTTENAWIGGWTFVAALLHEAQTPPPPTEAVLRGWLNKLHDSSSPLAEGLARSPFLDVLMPSVFEIDGLGSELNNGSWATDGSGWDTTPRFAAAMVQLVEEGRLDRRQILDATIDRLVRGDRPAFLRPFVLLHDALKPTVDEMAGHAAEYARLLPDAPSTVAGLAQRALRSLDDAGRLEVELLLETSALALLRKEKTLVKAQLTLLERVARRERTVEVLETVAVGFAHPALDIQERALTLIGRQAGRLDPATVARLAEAATVLTGDLPARAATMFAPAAGPGLGAAAGSGGAAGSGLGAAAGSGGAAGSGAVAGLGVPDAAAGPAGVGGAAGFGGAVSATSMAGSQPSLVPAPSLLLPLPLPLPPAAMPPPIGGAAELAEEVAALVHEETAVRWERVLAGLVALAGAGDTTALAAALGPVLDRYPEAYTQQTWGGQPNTVFLGEAIRRIIDPGRHGGIWQRMISAVRSAREGKFSGDPHTVLLLRISELSIRWSEAPVPMLVATPALVNGSLDAEVLLARLQRAEDEGWQPWELDFEQALLRVPPGADATVRKRAAALTTDSGRRFAEWLEAGGLPPPVSTRFEQVPGRNEWPDHATPTIDRRMVVNLQPAGTGGLRLAEHLFTLTRRPTRNYFDVDLTLGQDIAAMVLPQHREVIAAWALPGLAALADQDQRDGGALLPLLAESSGPAGPAMSLALAYGLGARFEQDRAAAVDALVILASSPEQGVGLDGPGGSQPGGAELFAAVGADLGDLCGDGIVKPSRVALALADAHRAGATNAVWAILTSALPLLLPKAPRGLPDLLELGSQVAAATGARSTIAELDAVANRPGSTRLIKEAKRLRTVLRETSVGGSLARWL